MAGVRARSADVLWAARERYALSVIAEVAERLASAVWIAARARNEDTGAIGRARGARGAKTVEVAGAARIVDDGNADTALTAAARWAKSAQAVYAADITDVDRNACTGDAHRTGQARAIRKKRRA
ncbi:MAG: hypothetical protein H7Z43_03575 [Clostridia bacterium]|nr:hypothetical protein [Deltaproteobacteria bacterium]